jgi:voltage-gated potassium channel
MALRSLRRRLSEGTASATLTRLWRAALLQVLVLLVGTIGYRILGDGEYGWLECAYMTVITVTTVGYEETLPVRGEPALMIFTMMLVVVGMGAVLYFVTAMATFMIDGQFREITRRWRMDRSIAALKGHFIVGGLGATGAKILPDLLASQKACVLVDRNEERIQEVLAEYGHDVPYVIGDISDDDVLAEAGVAYATGLALSLGDDRENLFATLSARRLNKRLRIVVHGNDPRSEQKFLTAGADRVIYINQLGGMRMAGELMRPGVTNVLEVLLRDYSHAHQFEELDVPVDSPLIGKTLKELDWRGQTGALVVAAASPSGEYMFNPTGDFVIDAHCRLIVLVTFQDLEVVEQFLRTGRGHRRR